MKGYQLYSLYLYYQIRHIRYNNEQCYYSPWEPRQGLVEKGSVEYGYIDSLMKAQSSRSFSWCETYKIVSKHTS